MNFKKLRQLTFQTQIFLSSMILVIFPTILLSAVNAIQRSSRITAEYNTSAAATLTQMNQALDTLLENAVKVADTPLLNDDVGRAMVTNYRTDYLAYAQDSNLFRNLMRQTNRLNSTIQSVYFENRYGYTFEYNIAGAQQLHQIEENMLRWSSIMRDSGERTYFAPMQTDPISGRSVLPMIRLLLDGYDYTETGICYTEIDFQPIMELLSSSRETQNMLLIYNADNDLTWTVNSSSFTSQPDAETAMDTLSRFSAELTEDDSVRQSTLDTTHGTFAISGCINPTTRWRLIQVVSNATVTHAYRDTLASYFGIFLFCSLCGLILAVFLTRRLTHPVSTLCSEIDQLGVSNGAQIDESACAFNQELQRLIGSFNGLSQRLALSLKENYEIQLAEQQMRVQMLQFQINHHFLYNTLNVIKSLAGIHEIPEIETIATSMSELIRYNLEKFPVATLEEELQQVQRYMSIQNIRFPGKFCCDINIPPEFLSLKLPVFLFQPLVENSVEHGFSSMEDNCYISISCQLEQDKLHFLVADNGSGISAERLKKLQAACLSFSAVTSAESSKKHHSIGLLNVNQRLRSYYGSEYGLSIESMEGEGTIIDLILPDLSSQNQ